MTSERLARIGSHQPRHLGLRGWGSLHENSVVMKLGSRPENRVDRQHPQTEMGSGAQEPCWGLDVLGVKKFVTLGGLIE